MDPEVLMLVRTLRIHSPVSGQSICHFQFSGRHAIYKKHSYEISPSLVHVIML